MQMNAADPMEIITCESSVSLGLSVMQPNQHHQTKRNSQKTYQHDQPKERVPLIPYRWWRGYKVSWPRTLTQIIHERFPQRTI